jgi:hypothetical protein
MGRLLEIARAALTETRTQDAKYTDTDHGSQVGAVAITERVVENAYESPCWHCAGSGHCDCITCGHLEAHAAWTSGRCIPCSLRTQPKVQ